MDPPCSRGAVLPSAAQETARLVGTKHVQLDTGNVLGTWNMILCALHWQEKRQKLVFVVMWPFSVVIPPFLLLTMFS